MSNTIMFSFDVNKRKTKGLEKTSSKWFYFDGDYQIRGTYDFNVEVNNVCYKARYNPGKQ